MGQVLAPLTIIAAPIWTATLAILTATAQLLEFVYFFLIIIPISMGGLVKREDGDTLSTVATNPFAPAIVVKCPADRKKYAAQLKDQEIEIEWWNRTSGEARVCWKDFPQRCGEMKGVFLFCWDWSESGVPADVPKRGWEGLEAYTPNGTIRMVMPDGGGPVEMTWAAPIAGECKYWDRDWKFKKEAWQHSDTEYLTESFKAEKWMPPKKKIPNLGPLPALEKEEKHTAKRSIAEHFLRLPRTNAEIELDEFASHGALLIQSMIERRSGEPESGTHTALQEAFSVLLETHSEAYRGLWKRVTAPKPVPAAKLIRRMSRALMENVHGEDKDKLGAFVVGAVVQVITDRARTGRAGSEEFLAMDYVFEQIFGNGNETAIGQEG
ncbi:hypothetical protein KC343_g11944 [Hortaea werneckii]|nr:hypothetical protein KC352_g21914 [Hortaea werneckii]KAI7556734.1 hypothetical protein KC317_g12075 [Hortaea werneckii]KAI7602829.1 hypothetical protein KC346_g12189 [Hortaea werneckii]KAI7610424.1 hypothetical protein KC343_g11944 [Hortaea werneckii]KAI7644866.1 hypothetical protein KC319_g12183 [Hortaea werneckii]